MFWLLLMYISSSQIRCSGCVDVSGCPMPRDEAEATHMSNKKAVSGCVHFLLLIISTLSNILIFCEKLNGQNF